MGHAARLSSAGISRRANLGHIGHQVLGNGDAHLKNFSVLETSLGDFALSPAYDLLNTSLHLPNECQFALSLFADDYETPSFRGNGYYVGGDLAELANRLQLLPARAARIRDEMTSSGRAMEDLIAASLLGEEAREAYLQPTRERLELLQRD